MNGTPISCAALLTPPGMAAIAVVRLRGPKVAEFVEAQLSRKPRPDRCVHCRLMDGDRVIDDPVVVLSDDGFTLDLNVHGGPWVVRSVLELCRRSGFEIVPAGAPFSDGGSIIEQEMLEAVPLARTPQALRLLLDQPRRWETFEWTPQSTAQVLADRTLWWMLHPPRVAIVGIPNAGKSTLANQLFGQERSITADIPGTTRDYVGDFATIDGLLVMLLDTPGQRHSDDPIELAAITLSRAPIEAADLILLVIDPTQPPAPQQELIQRYPRALHVLNKSDLVAADAPGGAVATVATTGAGVDALRQRIAAHFGIDLQSDRPAWWTEDQRLRLGAGA
jgi:tRNA modification GTPase